MNYTYLLKCADDTLYCGWTNQLDKRLKAHNEGKGAKYTRGRRPVSLAYYEIFGGGFHVRCILCYKLIHHNIMAEASAHNE